MDWVYVSLNFFPTKKKKKFVKKKNGPLSVVSSNVWSTAQAEVTFKASGFCWSVRLNCVTNCKISFGKFFALTKFLMVVDSYWIDCISPTNNGKCGSTLTQENVSSKCNYAVTIYDRYHVLLCSSDPGRPPSPNPQSRLTAVMAGTSMSSVLCPHCSSTEK